MAVEINGVPGTPNNQVEQTSVSSVKTVDSKTHSSNTNTSTADTFTVSPNAEKLRIIESNINAQPDVDGARIDSLKSAIDAGRYDIDPLRVAEKLIELEAQFVA